MITANQLLLSIPCFKCVVLLLDIFNNYLPLRYTTTPTGRLQRQLVIDNAVYIYYAEAWILGHQNNAKHFTMMQQICANGPLHFPEESDDRYAILVHCRSI
jgi:hypothetical protein